jgi:MoaA/NifB/PqqE/SkfB family radical SAM enzyme
MALAREAEAPSAPRFDFVSKLAHFPERVHALRGRDLVGAISTIYLDVNTDICNHACSFCDGYYRELHMAQIPWIRLERLLDEMVDLHVLAVVIAGDRGEPFLHPRIRDLLSRLNETQISYGLYTNGTRIKHDCLELLRGATFLRFSADAATSTTHREMHRYPKGRQDFDRLLSNLERLSAIVPDLGVSFIIDPLNVLEIQAAADLFLSHGARFIEYKPRYLPGYEVDAGWLAAASDTIAGQLQRARRRWSWRVVVNNQVSGLLDAGRLPSLTVRPRTCLTSVLRLVISTHGCYTCTPYRGEPERRVGDVMTQSLREVVSSAARGGSIDRPCSRLCAYHEQNEALLAIDDGRAVVPRYVPPQSRQDRML